MGRCYPHLDLEERRKLAGWLDAKMPVREIAEALCRAPSTIYREIKRNFYRDDELPQLNGYHPMNAPGMYERRRAIHRKLLVYPRLKVAVEDGLKAGWSPEQIAGRMRLERHRFRVGHETIYRYAYSDDGRAEQFYRHLPEHRRRRRPRGMRRHHGLRLGSEYGIALRPPEVADRIEFGHWECDLVFRQLSRPRRGHGLSPLRKEFGKANVTSLVERVCRYTVVLKNADRQSKTVMEAVIAGLAGLPVQARRSITFVRGTEFTAWRHLQAGLGIDPWLWPGAMLLRWIRSSRAGRAALHREADAFIAAHGEDGWHIARARASAYQPGTPTFDDAWEVGCLIRRKL